MRDLKDVSIISLYFRFVIFINFIAKAIGGCLLCIISVTVFASVISRFIPGFSLTWVEELVTYALAWLSTLGGGLAVRHGDMTAVTIVISAFPAKIQKIFRIISCIISLAIFICIIQCGYQMALVGSLRKSVAIPEITMFWLYLALPAGMTLMFLNTIARIIEIINEGQGKGGKEK